MQVGGDLLGPGEGVVHHVAGEELHENGKRHGPEQREGEPVLEGVVGQIDRRMLALLEGLRQLLGGDLGMDFSRHVHVEPHP